MHQLTKIPSNKYDNSIPVFRTALLECFFSFFSNTIIGQWWLNLRIKTYWDFLKILTINWWFYSINIKSEPGRSSDGIDKSFTKVHSVTFLVIGSLSVIKHKFSLQKGDFHQFWSGSLSAGDPWSSWRKLKSEETVAGSFFGSSLYSRSAQKGRGGGERSAGKVVNG